GYGLEPLGLGTPERRRPGQVFSLHLRRRIAPILLGVSMLTMVIVSLMGDPPPKVKTEDLTWTPAFWRAETERLKTIPMWQNYRVQSFALVVLTLIVVAMFW
ncbi:MAG: hypothetical protein AAGF99_16750, partial [Bacteroidota bacterium]